jgi:hypothetical protein
MAKTTAAKLAGLTIADALAEPSLLGGAIRDPESWKPWRALLAAAFGLPLDDYYQCALFHACTGRAVAPTAACNYLWLVIGRRGGKSFAMAIIAVFLACFRDWTPNPASPTERVERRQAAEIPWAPH